MNTIEDQIKCIGRELGLRRNVYKGWVESNRMKPEAAEREIATMEQVLISLKTMKLVQELYPQILEELFRIKNVQDIQERIKQGSNQGELQI